MMSQSLDPSLNISINQSLNDNMSIASSAFDQLKSERLGVPNKLIIDGFFYCFKDSLRNNRFSYRCRKRTCGVLLTIDKSELDKLKYGGSTDIYYCISKEHNCVEPETKSKEEESVLTERDLYNKGKSSILIAVDKPLAWHVKNLNELGITMTTEQIKNILRYEREKKFPYDTQFLYSLNNITITLDCVNIGMTASDDNILAKNLPFCYNINKVLNPEKGNREEKYVVFTSLPQIKHFSGSNELFIDCNYKICPKGYYQILTIMSYNPELKSVIPAFIIPMSHKSKNIYSYIFNTILSILSDNHIKYNDKVKIYCEFEYIMRKELKKIFPHVSLRGTYYHYIKRLWIKAKKMGLIHKNLMEHSHQIIFALEVIPFLKTEYMDAFLKEIKDYIDKLPENCISNFQRFIKYYESTWHQTNFIHFDQISASEWNRRGNNNCEAYHFKLSNTIEYFFPKMASFVKRIKDLIKDYSIGTSMTDESNQSFNTYEAVYLFVLDYHENYKKVISFNGLYEMEDDFKNRMEKINIDDMKAFLGLQCISGMENEDDVELNEYNYSEIDQILVYKEEKEKAKDEKEIKNHIELIDTGYDKEKNNEKRTYSAMNKFEELYAFEANMKD